jgi:hypothetical protein
MPFPALYWVTDKVGGPESRSVTSGKPISSLFTSWKPYPSYLNPSELPCLTRQAVFSSGEGRLGILLEGLQEVVWAANLVGWAHGQVGGSSSRPTHLSGTAVSLVGGDPGVPMSHNVA